MINKWSIFYVTYIVISVLLEQCSAFSQIHVLFRHGERSPTKSYPNDPHKNYKWEGGFGQLTNNGKHQMYTLGLNLRKHYNESIPRYYWPEETKFFSSYADRCLMSAELVAAGLFPPKDYQIWNENLLWQPIPITYVPRSQDNLIAMKQKCPTYDKMFDELQMSEIISKINKENADLFQFLTNHTGMNITNIENVETLYNTLLSEQLSGLSLPKWVDDILLEKMKILGARNLALYSETKEMQRLKGGMWLKKVLNSVKSERELSHLKVYLYSGHDISIVHVLRALNLADENLKPDFGAAVIFELHENELDHLVKMYYRPDWKSEQNRIIPAYCPDPCTLYRLKDKLKEVIPLDWNDECEIH